MGGTDDQQQSVNGDAESRPSPLLRQLQAQIAEIGTAPLGEFFATASAFDDGISLVALTGEIDMSNAADLRRVLDAQIGPGPCELIVELSRLTFIDSSGINELLNSAKTLKGNGGEIVLVAPTTVVARVFELVRLDEFIPVAESLEDALAQVRSGQARSAPQENADPGRQGGNDGARGGDRPATGQLSPAAEQKQAEELARRERDDGVADLPRAKVVEGRQPETDLPLDLAHDLVGLVEPTRAS